MRELPSSSSMTRAPSGLPGPPGNVPGLASLRSIMSGVACQDGHSALLTTWRRPGGPGHCAPGAGSPSLVVASLGGVTLAAAGACGAAVEATFLPGAGDALWACWTQNT